MKLSGLKYSAPMLLGRRVLFLFLVFGCTKANPSATCPDGTCTDPDFPYCDTDGSIGGIPNECVAVSCTPGEIKECRGDAAFACSAAGNGYGLQSCDLGCSDNPTSHCKYLQPKYLPDVCDAAATVPTLSISSTGMLDPNLDTSCTGGVVSQGGTDLCVVRAGTIAVTSAAVLTVVGTSDMHGRAIALVADQELSIDGTIDVGAHKGINGPGGGTFSSGGSPQIIQPNTTVGGGGAGGATTGASGATGNISAGGADGGGANAGMVAMNPALLASFVGGASSGALGATDTSFGGGGGALLLVSCNGSVDLTGTINAGGGGGDGGYIILLPIPPHGGGAGGNVVIQGKSVSVTGQVFANGGGGGGGWMGSTLGAAGEDGSRSDTAPAAGGDLLNGSGIGGRGGFVGNVPAIGTHPTGTDAGPGAGGGSVGFLQIYMPMGSTPTVTPSHVSPAFQPNGVVETR
jgi:hypothetical protein